MATGIFKKGSIEMLTLLMLQERDIYGYQLIQQLEERSGGKLTVQEGSLYPLLYRMVESGYISCRDITVETQHGRKRNRVLYHLEPSGRTRLIELKAEFDQIQAGIQSVFEKTVPVGYEAEACNEQRCAEVSAANEKASLLSALHGEAIPAPIQG